MKATFAKLDQTSPAGKAGALASMIVGINEGAADVRLFSNDPRSFSVVPGSPFAYWVPATCREAFRLFRPLEVEGVIARQGLATANDFRFVRAAWETRSAFPAFSKGGRYATFYDSLVLVVRWVSDGAELKAWASHYEDGGHWSRRIFNTELYGRSGVTWSRRSQRGLSMRLLPTGCIFSDKGPTVFHSVDGPAQLKELAAVLNSKAFQALVALQMSFGSYEVGVIQRTPIPGVSDLGATALGELAHRAWSLKRSLDTITETSHAFHIPAILQVVGATLTDRATAYATHVSQVESELATIQAEIDDIAFRLYGIDGEDRARIEAESAPSPGPSGHPLPQAGEGTGGSGPTGHPLPQAGEGTMGARHALPEREGEEPEDEPDDEEYDGSAADTATLATELLSWAIGVAFGRFDIRHATGELPAPIEPGPFDPLPARSPGMCPDDSLAVAFLVDDPGHALDLGKRIADVFAAVFPADHEARLDEAVRLAGSSDLQAFLRRTYFSFHLKRYSKSRRKAPIWWPLSTANGTYTVWLAWPQLTRDTLFRVADEIKRQKLPFETRRLVSLKQEHGPNPTSRDKATIAAQEDLVSELSALLEEIERVAPLWNPVPDDGVILHYALLWRVVRDAAWQKECRSAWDKLAKGDYDWAHVAMHLWPERVAPKCRSDRSLAIAHGLEDTFWVEVGGKWRARLSIDEEALLASTRLLDLFTVAAFKELRKWAVDRGDATAFDSWWTQLGSGQNETDPVALLLWPERVFERCRRDREFAHVHKLEGLFGSALSDRSGSGRATTWAERLADHRPAEMSALVQAIDDAIGRLRAEGSAAGFWESLDAGAFDDMALARLVRPSAAVSRARADLAVAEAHGLTDTFWLLGRKRVDPERESEVAIAARTSTAIKSALRAFVEAPSPGRSARGKRGG